MSEEKEAVEEFLDALKQMKEIIRAAKDVTGVVPEKKKEEKK